MLLDNSPQSKASLKYVWAVVVIMCLLYGLYHTQIPSADKVQQMEYIDTSVDGSTNSSMSSMVDINVAHSQSMPHRGVWMYLVNENEELLLTKRTTESVTCPGSWNVLGEHTQFKESFEDTAYRGLREEVGLKRFQVISVVPLFKKPLHLEITFNGPRFKQDIQWTQSFLVRVKQESIKAYNHETSLMQWRPLKDCVMWANEDPKQICTAKEFKYTSAELNASKNDWSFKEAFELHVKLIRQHL